MNLSDVEAMVAVGRMGMKLAASRLISLCAVAGAVALAAYVIQSPSWEGVVVVGLVSGFGLLPALAFERRQIGGQDE